MDKSECDLRLDVLSGTCTEEERLAFERHLPGCEACRAEMDELRLIWEALYADMEQIEPPADLKQQVMDAAMAARGGTTARMEEAPRAGRKSRRRLLAVSASAIVVLFLAGSAWNLWLYNERRNGPPPIEEALNVSASRVELAVPLQSEAPAESRAYGIACIVDNGRSKQFVVYVYGAAPTSGEQAYQVWLVKDGIRKSAGTFRVEDKDKGLGVLAMPIESDTLAFDRIGITLEPDDKGDQPRGEKMFGSA